MLFSIYSIAQFRLLKQDLIKDSAYKDCMSQAKEEVTEKMNDRTSYLLSTFGVKAESGSKRTSYLHISSLIQDKSGEQKTDEAKWTKKLLIGTILELYGDKKFFKDANMTAKRVEEMINLLFQSALDTPTKDFHKSPHALSNVHLNDPILQEVFYKIMKGNIPPKGAISSKKENYPSLADYIRFEKKGYIMSLYLAPKELLMALFEDESLVEELLHLRTKIYAEQQRATKQKKANNKDPQANQNSELDTLKQEFDSYRSKLPSGMPPHLVDFTISGSNPNARQKNI